MRKLLFFHASWCSPCKFYEKEYVSAVERVSDPEKIIRIDAWKNPQLAEKYHVERLPTVVLIDGEKIYKTITGALDVDRVADWLKGAVDNV